LKLSNDGPSRGKYQFGMPLYRTAALLRRFGGDLASNTLAAGVVHS